MQPTEFMRAYEAATNAHDLAGTLGLIADDAIYLFSDRSSHIGKKAIGEALEANFNSISSETYRIHEIRWLAAAQEIAACVYRFEWSGEIDGKPASGSGRGTTVLRRIEGNWRVAHEHLSRGGL